jgi:hypothetical protein
VANSRVANSRVANSRVVNSRVANSRVVNSRAANSRIACESLLRAPVKEPPQTSSDASGQHSGRSFFGFVRQWKRMVLVAVSAHAVCNMQSSKEEPSPAHCEGEQTLPR